MGRGDLRSKKGKINNGSFGKSRKARVKKANAVAIVAKPKKEKKAISDVVEELDAVKVKKTTKKQPKKLKVNQRMTRLQSNLVVFVGIAWSIFLLSCESHSNQDLNSSSDKQSVVVDTSTIVGLPSITGVNHNGESISIDSIQSKYILLEFWASWCKPCRQFNPGLVKVYNQFHPLGFEIFSVSLDSDESKWKEAIAHDNLSWKYHIYDPKGWDSPLAMKYKIEFIPNNILFDSKGNIIAKEMEPDQLSHTLEGLFFFKQ